MMEQVIEKASRSQRGMKRCSFQQFMCSNMNVNKDESDRSVFNKSDLGPVGGRSSVMMMVSHCTANEPDKDSSP